MTNPALQFDLFTPFVHDLALRDQREIMERPFFSLSKKRFTPIEYTGRDGSYVKVNPHPEYGLPTIWDADILIWAGSTLNQMKHERINDIPRMLRFLPNELLRSIYRKTGGSQYQQLRSALQRFKHTTITTSIRAGRRTKYTEFNFIESWSDDIDHKTALSYGMTMTLSEWFRDGALMDGALLQINPEYFALTGGYERWLYKISRKHAGGAGPGGFVINFSTLYQKSGSEGTFRRFKFEIFKIVTEKKIPDFAYAVENRDAADPQLRIYPAKVKALQSSPKPKAAANPGDAYNRSRDLLDHTRLQILKDFAGVDVDALKGEFDTWLATRGSEPDHYSSAFYGFVKKKAVSIPS